MNTANLQMEGLLLAIGAITRVLCARGLLAREELEAALQEAEAAAAGDAARPDKVSAANVEAILFPIRFLRMANAQETGLSHEAFSALTRKVAQNKDRP